MLTLPKRYNGRIIDPNFKVQTAGYVEYLERQFNFACVWLKGG